MLWKLTVKSKHRLSSYIDRRLSLGRFPGFVPVRGVYCGAVVGKTFLAVCVFSMSKVVIRKAIMSNSLHRLAENNSP
jgi:hypothetical protein